MFNQMCERKCTYMGGRFCNSEKVNSGDNNGCYLMDSTNHQSEHGGRRIPDADLESASGGPYWSEDIWDKFIENNILEGVDKGCLIPGPVRRHAIQITFEKLKKGQIFKRRTQSD